MELEWRDARDLKSLGQKRLCGFESRFEHRKSQACLRLFFFSDLWCKKILLLSIGTNLIKLVWCLEAIFIVSWL